ncbi:MAG: PqqD family protein [Bacteroidota bacterium]|jgi:hypothetical protein
MSIFKNKKNKNLNYLDLTPYALHKHELKPDGLVDVLVPRFKNKFFEKAFLPRRKSPYIKANLDTFGSETWLLINGKNKVGTIVELLSEKFGDSVQPATERVTLFFTQLYSNNFISFIELERK